MCDDDSQTYGIWVCDVCGNKCAVLAQLIVVIGVSAHSAANAAASPFRWLLTEFTNVASRLAVETDQILHFYVRLDVETKQTKIN